MKNLNQHILHQINMEINTSSENRAFQLKSDLDSFLKDEFLPRIEYLLDEMIPENQTVRYNSLDLEIDLKPNDSLQMAREVLINQLRNKLDFALPNFEMNFGQSRIENHTKISGKAIHSKKSDEPSIAEPLTDEEDSLLYFLETGLLPWFENPIAFSASLESKSVTILMQNKVFIRKLVSLFEANPDALDRFVQQMNQEIVLEVIKHLSDQQHIDHTKLRSKVNRLTPKLRISLFKLIISTLIKNDELKEIKLRDEILNSALPEEKEIIHRILKMVGFQDEWHANLQPENPEKKVNGSNPNNQIGIKKQKDDSVNLKAVFIQNAGLILTHPFLPQLFAITGCLDEHKQLLPDKQQKAVQLLHYLATGEETDMEFNLTFEKYLCGLSLQTPLTQQIEIDLADKQECEEVLRSMVNFWPALKNTSPDGLRQMFFHRNGKLDLHKSPHKLYIERKAQDVLLDKLQWNISIVKLPWMDDLLFVEW